MSVQLHDSNIDRTELSAKHALALLLVPHCPHHSVQQSSGSLTSEEEHRSALGIVVQRPNSKSHCF